MTRNTDPLVWVLPCAACKGKGGVSYMGECRACHGQGMLRVLAPPVTEKQLRQARDAQMYDTEDPATGERFPGISAEVEPVIDAYRQSLAEGEPDA